MLLKLGSKTVSAFTFNNVGDRFAAGGYDFDVRIWDFKTIFEDDNYPEPINNVQPCEQSVVKQLQFSNDDQLILVISGSCQACIIAKDGTLKDQITCPKGDPYIADMTNTKGHVQMLNDGCWNPKEDCNFMTCSNDATIRLWDLNKMTQQKTVIKTRSPTNGLKSIPNVCKYNRDSLSIVAGCNDGCILMWDTRRKFFTTSNCIKNAHYKGSEITGLDYSYCGTKLCSRSEDETCKLWDLRQLKQALATRTGLTTLHSTTDCCFSPDDQLILTGTSCTKNESGQLHFLDSDNLTSQHTIDMPDGTSVIRVRWHADSRHIGFSCTNGRAVVTHDDRRTWEEFLSSNSGRGTKRKKHSSHTGGSCTESVMVKKIITPHALPLFQDTNQSSRGSSAAARSRCRDMKSTTLKSSLSTSETDHCGGGGIRPAGSTLSSYIARSIAKPIDDGGMSIRDRILRHADVAEREPMWIMSSQDTAASATAATQGHSLEEQHDRVAGDDDERKQQQQQQQQQHPQQEL